MAEATDTGRNSQASKFLELLFNPVDAPKSGRSCRHASPARLSSELILKLKIQIGRLTILFGTLNSLPAAPSDLSDPSSNLIAVTTALVE